MVEVLVAVAWPYSSGPRHIGHAAGAYIPADIFARFQRMAGNRVLMVSGSDMHGTPTTVRAEEEGVPPEEVAERYHALHTQTFEQLGISYDLYWNTAAKGHADAVQEIFLRLLEKGHIYEGTMDSSWCPSCQQFRPDRYIEGECPHCHFSEARGDQCEQCGRLLEPFDLIGPRCKVCGSAVERRETRQFFFRLSAFQEPLKAWLEKKTGWRSHVLNFALSWLEEGLKDRPVTRDLTWGIPVPVEGYEDKSIYVWIEAVMGYLTTSQEWARRQGREDLWKEWWYQPQSRHCYFIGKDNIVFHTILWPAILMGYDEKLQLPTDVPANQFMNLAGRKMSAGRGVGSWLPDLLKVYDPDALRYYVAASMPETKDSEFSEEDLAQKNNSELVAVYGNFVHRVLTFTHKNFGKVPDPGNLSREDEVLLREVEDGWRRATRNLEYCHFKDALREVMQIARRGNQFFDSRAPWDLLKSDREACGRALYMSLRLVQALVILMAPFLPFSSNRLWKMLGNDGEVSGAPWEAAMSDLPIGRELAAPLPLFERIDKTLVDPEEEASRLDIRVGKVLSVQDHPQADKLYLVDVDLGKEQRRLVAGLKEEYGPEEILGKDILVLCNLQPATLRGIRSEGMLLAAVEGDEVSLLLATGAAAGDQVLGQPGAPTISFEEFRKLKLRVDKDGGVRFFGTGKAEGSPLRINRIQVRVDRPIPEGSEVT